MLTLITGVPGAGKTCYSMRFLLEEKKKGRPIFVHGIPDLKIPHEVVYCSAISCEVCRNETELDTNQKILMAEEWHDWAPDGAYIVFDEVQNVYRPRSHAKEVPGSVKALETHRHRGIDFLLMSQSPMLFDSNVRRLVSRHIHLKSNWSGRIQYEWPEVKEDPKSIGDAIRTPYKLEKKNFDLYKSAQIHTKIKRKIPKSLYVVGIAFIALPIIIYAIINRMSDRLAGPDPIAVQDQSALAINPGSGSNLLPPDPGTRTGQNNLYDFSPRNPDQPYSAPAFDEVVEVKDFPRVSACLVRIQTDTCTCYSQQGTKLSVTQYACLQYVENRHFDPFRDPERDRTQRRPLADESVIATSSLPDLSLFRQEK